MSDQIQEVLDVFAVRFGATGEHLWEVLVRQQVVEGWVSIIAPASLFIVGAIFALYTTWHYWGEDADAERHPVSCPGGWSGIAAVTCFALAVLVMLTFGILGILKLINPEFYALKELLP